MKNAVFGDVVPCRSCVNSRFGGRYRLHLQGTKIRERGISASRWLQTEPPVENIQLYKNREGEWATWEISREERGRVSRSTRRHIPEDGILHRLRVSDWEQGSDENVWSSERESSRMMEGKLLNEELQNLYCPPHR
jgi:hypothetical protein